MLVPQTSIPEVLLRGSIMYLMLFLALRYLMKRHAGQVGIADILVIVLISEAAQNAMVGEAKSLVEAAFLVGTILFWSYVINWLSDRVPFLRSLGGGDPVPLIQDGRFNRRNMDRELLTEDELMSQLRQHGIERVAEVKRACLEPDGNISVIRVRGGDEQKPAGRTRGI
ncbi:DUF421 domain-containing protein [Enterovirga sp. DB1703]|uniref:DUF421 domain-containing protein n=2 Tax=Enterovirga aerilata TaxID=2730920 RepID=A0A849I4Y3_9HYPH|nr:YetF domain-containing protein [Enterovirga sp. DB1703]NNM71449.1 DUF421 domain-containing protein [Enterovirga sp. DB1703]